MWPRIWQISGLFCANDVEGHCAVSNIGCVVQAVGSFRKSGWVIFQVLLKEKVLLLFLPKSGGQWPPYYFPDGPVVDGGLAVGSLRWRPTKARARIQWPWKAKEEEERCAKPPDFHRSTILLQRFAPGQTNQRKMWHWSSCSRKKMVLVVFWTL